MSPASDDESDDDGGGGEAVTDGSRRTRGSGSRSQNQDGAWFGDRRARPGDGAGAPPAFAALAQGDGCRGLHTGGAGTAPDGAGDTGTGLALAHGDARPLTRPTHVTALGVVGGTAPFCDGGDTVTSAGGAVGTGAALTSADTTVSPSLGIGVITGGSSGPSLSPSLSLIRSGGTDPGRAAVRGPGAGDDGDSQELGGRSGESAGVGVGGVASRGGDHHRSGSGSGDGGGDPVVRSGTGVTGGGLGGGCSSGGCRGVRLSSGSGPAGEVVLGGGSSAGAVSARSRANV